MSKTEVKFSCSDIAEMMSICNVRNDCNRSCIGCDYNNKGHKICRDMLKQFNDMSRSQQISIIVKCKNM